MSDPRKSPEQVRDALQQLAQPVVADVQARHVRDETAALRGLALPTLAFPAAYLALTWLLALLGVDLRWPWFVLLPLTAALPALRVKLRRDEARKMRVREAAALAMLDKELHLEDRLSAAREFADEAEPDGFMLAAMHDADRRMQDARGRMPRPQPREPENAAPMWLAGVGALVLLYVATQITPATLAGGGPPQGVQRAGVVATEPRAETPDEVATPAAERVQPEPRRPRRAQQDASDSSAGEDENPTEAQRKGRNPMGSGRSAEARTAAGGGSERGQPSNQAQSTKGGKAKKPNEKKKDQPRSDEREREDEAKTPPQESGSTQGRGSGKGSSKSPTASPWSAKDQVVTDEEEDPDEDEEVDDENDESKARGGVQPNLRQRKPPVNRDLQISMGNGQPQDDANGRGGPGGPKKQRGVAQLVLGVTFPDHVSAKPNPGISKLTQERIEPQAQQGDQVPGESRGARAAPMGHLTRRALPPWMQGLVRSFYLSLREEGGPQ
ncbi:MAG: hypothetical protein VYD05_12520 [Planctomycetota bacterium]|nr:hypothetical protein [Planctomycetota bacterium]